MAITASNENQPGQRNALLRWAVWWPIASLVGALSIAVIGAIITGSQIGGVVGSVEGLSADSGNFLNRVGDLFPLGFAFSAGLVSSVNPCGFAMLPAYLGLYLGDDEQEGEDGPGLGARLQRAVLVGSTVTAGFVIMFAVVGVPIGLGARGLVGVFPWVGLGIGVLLAIAGTYMLSGGKLYNNLAMRLSSKMGNANNNSMRGYFTFGLGYGTASLSCTLPIFLAVIGGTFTADTFLDSLLQFVLYGFGMGTVILVLTVGMAVFKGAMVGGLRKMLPHVAMISAVMLLVSGTFIVYYWLTIGELMERIRDGL
jgi:cytochrome c biogenesis protein CcdA